MNEQKKERMNEKKKGEKYLSLYLKATLDNKLQQCIIGWKREEAIPFLNQAECRISYFAPVQACLMQAGINLLNCMGKEVLAFYLVINSLKINDKRESKFTKLHRYFSDY